MEQKLQDKMLGFMEIENNFGTEISKLMAKLSDTEKTFKDIKSKSNTIIENQELQIQSLNGDIFTLKGKYDSSLKEVGKLEKNLKEMNTKYEKAEKDYQNKCKILEDANNKKRNEITLKDTSIYELNMKNTSLSSLVAEREKGFIYSFYFLPQVGISLFFNEYLIFCFLELTILRDANNEWKCKKDLMVDNLKKEKEEILNTVEELNNKTEELCEELKEKSLKVDTLEEELKVCNNEIATLEKEKSLYKALLVELEKDKDNLMSKNRKLESEIKELLEGRNNLESNLIKLKTNFDELKNNLVVHEQEKTEMSNELKRSKIGTFIMAYDFNFIMYFVVINIKLYK